MKLETLARKLAARTDTPQLERVILGEVDVQSLPDHCMIWQGNKNIPKSKRKMIRFVRSGEGYLQAVTTPSRSYASVKYNNQRWLVQRLIFILVARPKFDFRMTQQCSTPLCVNPLHWEVNPVGDVSAQPSTPEPPEPSEEWTPEIVLEMVEAILGDVPPPSSWEEVINHIDMLGAPEDEVRKVLIELNKEHLT